MSGQTRTPRVDAITLRLPENEIRLSIAAESVVQYNDLLVVARALEIENAELREALLALLSLADNMRMTDVYLAGDMRDHARESARELLLKSKGAE